MKRISIILFAGILFGLLAVYFVPRGISTGDSGDLVTAACTFGVPHPPGYPLYTFVSGLLCKIPIESPAFRVSLVSLFSHILVLLLVFDLVKRVTKRVDAGLFASIALLGNYVFFNYSITPEVFALMDFFVIAISWEIYLFKVTKQIKYFYLFIFTFSLSLSHHHMIVFLIPAIVWFLYKNSKIIKLGEFGKSMWYSIGLFFAGLLPYIYLYIAGLGNSPVNWHRPTNIQSFVALITREIYGTFQSNRTIGEYPLLRVLQFSVYGKFVLLDFTPVLLFCAFLGLLYLWKKQRDYAIYMIISIVVLGPLFLSYASFPILGNFMLGTVERFLLPSYILLYVLSGIGFYYFVLIANTISQKYIKTHVISLVLKFGISFIVFVNIIVLLLMTLWRFWTISTDYTADNLGHDILRGVKPSSMVLVGNDTPLFTTQYVRYVLNVRKDIILLHSSLLSYPFYRESIRRIYPEISVPEQKGSNYISEFIEANEKKYTIYSNQLFYVNKERFWVLDGLLYTLEFQDTVDDNITFSKRNSDLWATFQDPTKGILSRYRHLMLSDVLDVYGSFHNNLGRTYLKSGQYDLADKEFTKTIKLQGDKSIIDAYIYKGFTKIFQKECDAAFSAFSDAKKYSLDKVMNEKTLYDAITYSDCLKDSAKATELFASYEKQKDESEAQVISP